MNKIYVLALSLMMISFSYGQKAQLSPELIKESTNEVQKPNFNNLFRSNYQTTSNFRSIQSTFFEGFENGIPNTWTIVDNDADGHEWHANNGYVNASNPSGILQAFEGDSCATVRYNGDGNDDWLISPAITIADGEEVSFFAASTGTFLESFNVKVSNSDSEVTSFTFDVATETEISANFARFAYSLTDIDGINAGDEIYIAIQCVSVDKFALRLDNFKVDPAVTNAIAYTSHEELDFEYLDVNETLESFDVSVSNFGINTLTVSDVTDLSTTEFSTTFDATAVSLEANASYTFTVTYSPTDLGEDTQDFVITTNEGNLTINLSGIGVATPAGIELWDNTEIGSLGAYTSTELGALTPGDLTMADDFMVEAGNSWTISSVVTKGFSNTAALIDNFTVKIYSDNEGTPGDEIFSEAITSNQANSFNKQTLVFENPYQITTPGKYWINIYAVYADGDDLNTSKWNTYMGATAIGSVAVLKDSPDLLGAGITDWTAINTIFSSAPNSLLFKIFGETEALSDPIAAIDQETLNFGYVDQDSELTSMEINLSNDGAGTVTATSISDLSSTDFTTTFDVASASATSETPYIFTISYNPSDLGEDSEDFVITTNAGDLTIALTGNGAEAPVGTELWDNTNIGEASGFYSCELGVLDPGDLTMADDFIIEAGQSWAISAVSTIGFSNTAAAIDNFTLKIYADNNGVPGNEIFSEAIITNQNNDFNNQTLKLATPFNIDEAGTYWINIYAVYTNGDALATSAWSTYMGQTAIGAGAVFKDSPNALGYDLTSWTAINEMFEAPAPSSLYFKIFGDITTNVNSINTSNINLFPNPTTGIVNITNTELNTVAVYNMLGQVLSTLENVQKIDLSSFENGTYIVKVISENNTITKKVNLIK